jgi:hypothetical protein
MDDSDTSSNASASASDSDSDSDDDHELLLAETEDEAEEVAAETIRLKLISLLERKKELSKRTGNKIIELAEEFLDKN